LQGNLKLELSEEKTLITHAKAEAARFLGYEVTTLQEDEKRAVTRKGTDRRNINGRIGLRIPKDVLEAKCASYLRNEKARHRPELEHEEDYTILMAYQLEYRGIANYYRLAYNLHTLNKLKWIMETSLLKTLALKLKVSVTQVVGKYRAELVVNGKKYKVFQAVIPRQDREPLVATWGGVPLSWDIKATLEDQPSPKWMRSELVRRLLVGYCELCGATENIEVHHVRAMKNLHQYPGRAKPEWVKRMIALKRKTMILCRTCHEDVTFGRPLRRHIIELADVKALQKEAMRRY
jgi:AI2M/AI1M-like, HNH endonuclease/Type II intron maturase